jgi:adenosine/AMP kinase
MLEIKTVPMELPADANIVVGQPHFIKTVEDLYEAMSTTVPQARFRLAFNESSGACLTRSDGNDQSLRDMSNKSRLPEEQFQPLGCSTPRRRLRSASQQSLTEKQL